MQVAPSGDGRGIARLRFQRGLPVVCLPKRCLGSAGRTLLDLDLNLVGAMVNGSWVGEVAEGRGTGRWWFGTGVLVKVDWFYLRHHV